MKLIVINDSDGHTWAVADTAENRAKLLEDAADAGVGLGDFDPDELPTGRAFGGVCEEIDTDKLADWPESNPFYGRPPRTPEAQTGLKVTLAELLVLVDALEASLHYKDLLSVYKFDIETRDKVLAALTQRMHATVVHVEPEAEARKAFSGLYPVGDE